MVFMAIENINHILDANNFYSKKYNIALRNIRNIVSTILKEIRKQSNEIGGTIHFFNLSPFNWKDLKLDNLSTLDFRMMTYPLEKKICLAIEPVNNNLEEILKNIEKERIYNVLFHPNHFKTKYDKVEHFFLRVQSIPKIDLAEMTIDGSSFRDYTGEKCNHLDWLHMKLKLENILLIPLSIFTSPIAILAIPNFFKTQKKALSFISDLYNRTHELMGFYFYNRLISSLIKENKELIAIQDMDDLIWYFTNEVAHALLPLRIEFYQNDHKKEERILTSKYWPTIVDGNTIKIDFTSFGGQNRIKQVVFYLTSYVYADNENRCVFMHKCESNLARKYFIKVMLENIFNFLNAQWVSIKEIEKSNFARMAEKKYSEIEKPLRSVIEDIGKINSRILYIQRRITPEYLDFLHLHNEQKLFNLYKKHIEIKFKRLENGNESEGSCLGMHEFEWKDLISNLKDKEVREYIEAFTWTIHNILVESKVEYDEEKKSFSSEDILAKIFNLLIQVINDFSEENKKIALQIIVLLKIVSHDAKESSNYLFYIQMLFYVWVANNKLNSKFTYSAKFNSISEEFNDPSNYLEFIKISEKLNHSIENYAKLKNNSTPIEGRYKLFNGISPGMLCGAIAQVCSEELHGEGSDKKVKINKITINNIYLQERVEGFLAITIECNNKFADNSNIRKLNIINPGDELSYHSLNSCFSIIEKAVNEPRKFIEEDPTINFSIQHKFSIFSFCEAEEDLEKPADVVSVEKTIICIIIGEDSLYKNVVTYSQLIGSAQ